MEEQIKQIISNENFVEHIAWKRHKLQANESIVREGEEGRSLFFIEEGHLRVTGHVETGR